jgi:hypothetical protein
MRKQLLRISSFLAFSFLILTSCDKGDDPPPPPAAKTKTELLTQSAWKYESSNPDVFSAVPGLSCYKDNIVTFSATGSAATNGTATMNEGTTLCTPTPQANYTWEFQSNGTVLLLNAPLFPGGSPSFTIVTLSETNLVVSQSVTTPFGAQNVTVTFKH